MVCEAFGCRPSEADEEDVAKCKRILRLREYRDCHALIEKGVEQKDLPDTPMMKKALEIQITKVKEVMSGRELLR